MQFFEIKNNNKKKKTFINPHYIIGVRDAPIVGSEIKVKDYTEFVVYDDRDALEIIEIIEILTGSEQ
jgi:hypothetical protein